MTKDINYLELAKCIRQAQAILENNIVNDDELIKDICSISENWDACSARRYLSKIRLQFGTSQIPLADIRNIIILMLRAYVEGKHDAMIEYNYESKNNYGRRNKKS